MLAEVPIHRGRRRSGVRSGGGPIHRPITYAAITATSGAATMIGSCHPYVGQRLKAPAITNSTAAASWATREHEHLDVLRLRQTADGRAVGEADDDGDAVRGCQYEKRARLVSGRDNVAFAETSPAECRQRRAGDQCDRVDHQIDRGNDRVTVDAREQNEDRRRGADHEGPDQQAVELRPCQRGRGMRRPQDASVGLQGHVVPACGAARSSDTPEVRRGHRPDQLHPLSRAIAGDNDGPNGRAKSWVRGVPGESRHGVSLPMSRLAPAR